MARFFGALIYFAGSVMWAALMVVATALRCDDSCSSNSSSWTDNPDAWQYDAIFWLGLVGLALAILAVTLSFVRRRLGIATLGTHVGVFGVNAVLLTSGSDAGMPWELGLGALAAAAAGWVAVGASSQRPKS